MKNKKTVMNGKDSKLTKEDSEFGDWMREFYNKKAKNLSDKGYEYGRWFSSKNKMRQYNYSKISLSHHLKDIEFKNCLEIGCGPGTWTEFLLERFPESKIDCLDISKEMINQHKEKIKSRNVKRIVSNFLDYKFDKKYDYVFFSRAIEYIPNKQEIIKKLSDIMEPGGKGIIITSPPHPLILSIKKVLGKKVNKNHTKRIPVRRMNDLLHKNNFKNIKFYPILFSDFKLIPTKFLFKNFYKKPWGLISRLFASGYLVKFQKPKNE